MAVQQRVRVKGLKADILAEYLAQVGLVRVLGSQADKNLIFGWTGSELWVDTAEDIVDFLLHRYQPTPIVSPWNGGSGFQPKDKNAALVVSTLLSQPSPRLANFQQTIRTAQTLVEQAQAYGWAKDRLALELRNVLPEPALDWLDAAIVLRGNDKPAFPPLLGTGGNDGHLEFSSKFHERLGDVLPELGSKTAKSSAWLSDVLEGTAEGKLVPAPVGMFDGMRSGGPASSSLEQGQSTVNPWVFVLMCEGLAAFSSSVSRRMGATGGKAAMPFTVHAGVGGNAADTPEETSRGEFWAPLVAEATWPAFANLVVQARASWDGARAQSVPSMYAAIRSFGVDRGVAAFHRFGFNQANGLAFVAVLLDRIPVQQNAAVALARIPLRRIERLQRATGAAGEEQTRRVQRAATAFVRTPGGGTLLDMLLHLTRAELVARRSERNREAVGHAKELVPAALVVELLEGQLESSLELRLAAGLASAHVVSRAAQSRLGESAEPNLGQMSRPMRDLILGSRDQEPVVHGMMQRPLAPVLADLAVWLSAHASAPAGSRGVVLVARHGYLCSSGDASCWANGMGVDEEALRRYFLAFLSVDWRGKHLLAPLRAPGCWSLESALLGGIAHGELYATAVAGDDARLGFDRSWAARLRANKVPGVVADAMAMVNRGYGRRHGASAAQPVAFQGAPFPTTCRDGARLLASAFAPCPPLTLSIPTNDSNGDLQ